MAVLLKSSPFRALCGTAIIRYVACMSLHHPVTITKKNKLYNYMYSGLWISIQVGRHCRSMLSTMLTNISGFTYNHQSCHTSSPILLTTHSNLFMNIFLFELKTSFVAFLCNVAFHVGDSTFIHSRLVPRPPTFQWKMSLHIKYEVSNISEDISH